MASGIVEAGAGLSVIIAGATGACGGQLVQLLVADPAFSRVVALTRVPVKEIEWENLFVGIDLELAKQKLVMSVIDFEEATTMLEEERNAAKEREEREKDGGATTATGNDAVASAPSEPRGFDPAAFRGHGYAANCLGMSFKIAKTAAVMRRVERDYAETFMELIKRYSGEENVHYSQVSFNGASPRALFPYARMRGKADLSALHAGFRKISIYKPGLLGRKHHARFIEKLQEKLFLFSKIPVEKVAEAIIGEWRGLYKPPEKLKHKLHNKYIHEAAGNYECRRSHETADIPMDAITPRTSRANSRSTTPRAVTPRHASTGAVAAGLQG